MSRVGGIVLCGGKSSRIGRPKAWLPFGGELLLPRVVRILRTVVDPIVVVAAPEQELPELPSSVLIARDAEEYLGPLSGLAGGLGVLLGKVEIAYLSSCDVPFLSPAFVQRVIDRLEDKMICLPEVGGYRHPLAAAYRIEVLPTVREFLSKNQLRPVSLSEAMPARMLGVQDFADVDPELRSLRNINAPDDYDAALRELNHAPAGPARGDFAT